MSNHQKNDQCTQCEENYQLNSKNNLCVYNKCSKDLYFETSLFDSIQNNNCVALCNPLNYKNQLTNLCQSQTKCSTSKNTEQKTFKDEQIQDFFVYQDQYYVVQTSIYLSIYNKIDLFLIKQLQLYSNDLNIFNSNEVIFVTEINNQISIWDIKNESRISKQFDSRLIISISKYSQIVSMQNQYTFIYNVQPQNIAFQIFYDLIKDDFCLSNSFMINIKVQSVIIIDSLLFINDSRYIFIYFIAVSNTKDHLKIDYNYLLQVELQSKLLNILSNYQPGIYFLVQDQEVQLINTNNNQIESITIGFQENQQIIKARIFKTTNIDLNKQLIIHTFKEFIFYNLKTNSSNIIISNSSLIKDFEICNFWGKENQLIVLYQNLDFSIFQYDLDLQMFIRQNQTFSLNYNPQYLKSIQFLNLRSNYKEYNNEIASISLTSIQILKKGNLLQQQKQLIQVDTLINFNLAYPVSSPDQANIQQKSIPKSILSYNPSLIIHVNYFGQINIYDSSNGINCKLKKQIWPQKVVNQIENFFNSKIIISFDKLIWIVDLFKQNVIKYFSSQYLLYATNNDKLITITDECLRLYSAEFLILYENCKFQIIFTINQTIYLNNDLKIILTEKIGNDNQDLSITLYQLDLKANQIQQLATIKNSNNYAFQMIKKFDSLQDEINNSFSYDNNFIYEYQIDIKKKNVYINGLDYVNNIRINPLLFQNKRNSINASINFIGGGENGLLFTSLSQKQRYFQIQRESKANIFQVTENIMLGVYFVLDKQSISYFDMFTNKQLYIKYDDPPPFDQKIKNLIRNNTAVTILSTGKYTNNAKIILVDFLKGNAEKNFKYLRVVFGINYDKYDNQFYIFSDKLIILDFQLKTVQIIPNSENFYAKCENYQFKVICVSSNLNLYYLAIFDKSQKTFEKVLVGNSEDNIDMIVDEEHQNIFITSKTKFLVYSFNGFLKHLNEKMIQQCKVYTKMISCISSNKFVLIDRVSFILNELEILEDGSTILNYFYIDLLNYLFFQTFDKPFQVSVIDVSTKQIINSFSSGIPQINIQDNDIPIQNDTFKDIGQKTFSLANFNLNFQDNINLVINLSSNPLTQQIIFQNITITLQCLGNNQIKISNIEKVLFQNIKISEINLKGCNNLSQQSNLFYFYNISQVSIYNLEIANINFYQTSQIPIFQFEIANNILINGVTLRYNTNLNSFLSFVSIQNSTPKTVFNFNRPKIRNDVKKPGLDSLQQFI
ncbi:hypothetical protein ABPG74_006615 [Tetrahymena malaccensis]